MIMSKCTETVDLLDPVVITKRPNGRVRVDHMNYEKSMTQQCFSESSDVNRIMTRWLSGGPPPVSDASRATFRDVSSGMDYREVCDRVLEVQESFDSLPADMRMRFANDPANLLDFVSNPANNDECIKLGLMDDGLSTNVDKRPFGDVKSPSEQFPLDVTVLGDTASVS